MVAGSDLYGPIFAHKAKSKEKSVLVIDRHPNIGGNVCVENTVC